MPKIYISILIQHWVGCYNRREVLVSSPHLGYLLVCRWPRLRGVLKPIRTVQQTATPGTNGKGTKQSFTTLQNDLVRGTATPLTTNNTIDARNKRNTSTGYNLRIPTTAVPPVGAAMTSARRFRASTHLAASIASEDPFTARAVEEIKE